MGAVKQNNGKISEEVLWETMVLPFFRFSGAERPLPRFDGLKRSMRGFDGTSLQVVEIAAGITMHVIGQIVIYIKYWEKDWGKR